MSLEPAMVRR